MQSIINQIIRLLEIYSAMIRNDEVVVDKLLNRSFGDSLVKEEMAWGNLFIKPNNQIPHNDIERQVHDGQSTMCTIIEDNIDFRCMNEFGFNAIFHNRNSAIIVPFPIIVVNVINLQRHLTRLHPLCKRTIIL